MDDDPFGFSSTLERDAVKVMTGTVSGVRATGEDPLRAWIRRAGSDSLPGRDPPPAPPLGRGAARDPCRQRDVAAYVALCEQTELSAQDCLAVATCFKLGASRPRRSPGWSAGSRWRRSSRTARWPGTTSRAEARAAQKLGRRGDALEEAWASSARTRARSATTTSCASCRRPSARRGTRRRWRRPSAPTSRSRIELWLETQEIERLVDGLARLPMSRLEELSHYARSPLRRASRSPIPTSRPRSTGRWACAS